MVFFFFLDAPKKAGTVGCIDQGHARITVHSCFIFILVKIDKDKRLVVLDEELEGVSPDELKDELPERQPRTFIVYSYKYQHDDGRVSYPLCFIFSSPVGCKPEQQMMYAGSKNKLVQTAELTKNLPLPYQVNLGMSLLAYRST
uniref:Glia maturation factor beta n=1 Tax=Oryctolagus cuniculus TaxID=9986 RepID=A0A5F9CBH2_RABIT